MKLDHVAALVLVGWYLMVPPDARPRLPANRASHAPLHYWMMVDSFDSVTDCHAAEETFFHDAWLDLKDAFPVGKALPPLSKESAESKDAEN
jgi:hypothetical protein